jgi:glycosyltransferase involved in cell wall biosynthesis
MLMHQAQERHASRAAERQHCTSEQVEVAPDMSLASVKICVLGLRGIPGVLGGVETHCEELYPRLAALPGAASYTVLARAPYASAPRITYRGVDVIALPTVRHPYLEAISHTFLGLFYARFWRRADIVHIHAIGPALLAPLAKLLGLRVVVTHHGRDYDRPKWNGLARTALRFGERLAVSFADQTIVVAPSLARDLRERFPDRASRITFVPNGAPAPPPASAAGEASQIMAQLGLEPRSYVLAVGRLVPEKGFHDLIGAAREAGKKVVIAGKADFEDVYSRSLVEKAGPHVVFAGFQGRAALRELYRNASLFVMPSYHEGMPIAALEAVGAGAPVLLSDIPAHVDFDLPAANYFPVGDVMALAEKLAGDPEAFAVDGEAFMRRYCWDEVSAETARAYGRIVGSNAHAVPHPVEEAAS